MLALTLFNMYTNDQSCLEATPSFLYADDLAIAAESATLEAVDEQKLTKALSLMTIYYSDNQLKTKLPKTELCAFLLKNRESSRTLQVMWNGTRHSWCNVIVVCGEGRI